MKLNYINFFSLFIKNYLIFSVYILKNINLLFSPKKIENYKPIFVSFFSYTNKTEATKGKYVSEYWKGFNYTKNKLSLAEKIFLPLIMLLPLDDELNFLKKFSLKDIKIYFKFITFFFPKRIFLMIFVLWDNFIIKEAIKK